MWVWWLGGWPGFINIRTGSGRGQRKGCWPGTVEALRDTSKCQRTSPAPSLWGKTKGKPAHVPRRQGVERGCGGVTPSPRRERRPRRGPRGRCRAEDADVRCGGEERHGGRKYNELLFGETTGADPRERQLRADSPGLTHTHERDRWRLSSSQTLRGGGASVTTLLRK